MNVNIFGANVGFDMPFPSGRKYDLKTQVESELAREGLREDAASTALTLRALTEVMPKPFEVKYPDLKARQILPVFTGVDPAAEGFVWRMYDRVGSAAVIHNAAADLPSSEVFVTEFQSRLISLGTSYNYSMQDLKRAAYANVPVEARKALAARRAMEQAVEQLAFFGLAQSPSTTGQALNNAPTAQSTNDPMAIYGFTNFPGLTVTPGTNNWASSSTPVATIVSDFASMFTTVINNSKGVHTPDTVVFPLSTYLLLAGTARSTTFTEDSVLQYLLRVNPWVKNVYWSTMLEKAGLLQDGSTPGPRIMVMERSSENLEMVIPQEFEQLPPQIRNFSFYVPCHMRFGGLRISYPKSILAFDGTAG